MSFSAGSADLGGFKWKKAGHGGYGRGAQTNTRGERGFRSVAEVSQSSNRRRWPSSRQNEKETNPSVVRAILSGFHGGS
jgi:hypothetical protein